MKLNNKSLLLYAVTDRRWSDNDTFYKHIEESLEGGVTFLQNNSATYFTAHSARGKYYI